VVAKIHRSISIDKHVACGTIKFHIALNKDSYPKKITADLPTKGTCRANIGGILSETEAALSKVPKALSLILKDDMKKIPQGFFVKIIIESLRGHSCGACAAKIAQRKDGDQVICKSCPDALSQAISEAMPKESQ
jgi:hypothetical protein